MPEDKAPARGSDLTRLLKYFLRCRHALTRIPQLENQLEAKEKRLRAAFAKTTEDSIWNHLSVEEQQRLRSEHISELNNLPARKRLPELLEWRSKAVALKSDSRLDRVRQQYPDACWPDGSKPGPAAPVPGPLYSGFRTLEPDVDWIDATIRVLKKLSQDPAPVPGSRTANNPEAPERPTAQMLKAERQARLRAAQERWRPIANRLIPFAWIHKAADVDHHDAYDWKNGKIPDSSVMSENLERILRQRDPPPKLHFD
jgi:hypothetical protein